MTVAKSRSNFGASSEPVMVSGTSISPSRISMRYFRGDVDAHQ
jgi:hypothetical protein